jgi:hypothetical protein
MQRPWRHSESAQGGRRIRAAYMADKTLRFAQSDREALSVTERATVILGAAKNLAVEETLRSARVPEDT